MCKLKRFFVLAGLVLFAAAKGLAQTPAFTYTQFMDNLTPLNPAASLLDKAGSVSSLARKQWVGIDGAPTTYLLNANLPFADINGAAGLIIFNDNFAVEHQTEVNAYFAKAIQLGEIDFLAVSLNAGLRNYTAYFSQLDSNDPEFKTDVRQDKPNIGFGVMYYTDTYYIGLSAPELTITSLGTASIQNNNNFVNHYYLAGAFISGAPDDDIKLKPAFLVSYAKGTKTTADISGTIILKDVFGIGFDYRTSNQAAGIMTINVDSFHIGYSYQFNVASSDLGGFNIPTHEVTITYRFGPGAATPKLL